MNNYIPSDIKKYISKYGNYIIRILNRSIIYSEKMRIHYKGIEYEDNSIDEDIIILYFDLIDIKNKCKRLLHFLRSFLDNDNQLTNFLIILLTLEGKIIRVNTREHLLKTLK